jgi:S1-C subfamily serine protease
MAVGNHDGGPLAAYSASSSRGRGLAQRSRRTIDSLIRLDPALSPAAEGGALIDLQGRVIGMTVLGPRLRALSIPSSTIDRAVDQLLARGHVFRGYLGAGLQPEANASGGSEACSRRRSSREHRSERTVGSRQILSDIVTAWNGQPIERVREIMRLLDPRHRSTVDLELMRGDAPTGCGCHRQRPVA